MRCVRNQRSDALVSLVGCVCRADAVFRSYFRRTAVEEYGNKVVTMALGFTSGWTVHQGGSSGTPHQDARPLRACSLANGCTMRIERGFPALRWHS